MLYNNEYDISKEKNKVMIDKLNKADKMLKFHLYDFESYKTDGYIEYPCKTDHLVQIEIKRRAKDYYISELIETGHYKYDTFQLMECYSTKLAQKEYLRFIIYDNLMKGCIWFTSRDIDFEHFRYVRVKSETKEYHYLKVYDIPLASLRIVRFNDEEN